MAASTCLRVSLLSFLNITSSYLFLLLLLNASVIASVEVLRPRGVALTKKVFYDPSKEFTCLDGSATIPFHYVNDDYCDCLDGTDEPGTAACPNGVFHCTNAGHKPINIPSSRVNDDICDCCDTSDEYNSSANCVNYCKDLGRRAREEAQRQQELLSKGFELKQEYSRQGQAFIEERKIKLADLEKEKNEAMLLKEKKEAIKQTAEEAEKVALDQHKNEEEERKKIEEEKRLEDEREREAIAAFEDMDADKDGKLTISEVRERWVFDQNKDGQVSVEEARFFLVNREEIDLDEFKRTGWTMMKPFYSLQKMFKPPVESEGEEQITETAGENSEATDDTATAEEPEQDVADYMSQKFDDLEDDIPRDEGRHEEEDEEEDENEENDGLHPPRFPPAEQEGAEKPAEEPGPVYDEETQKLIDVANEARKEFDEAEKNYRNLESELSKVQKLVEIDFGPENEFAPLYGQCVEYTDREYTYKLCPFEQATQRPKGGGSETNLGNWGLWHGPEENKYTGMKYEHGLTCWNGPPRSVEVVLSCGMENQLVSVSEPNRCSYVFEMISPAACSQPRHPEMHSHDEF